MKIIIADDEILQLNKLERSVSKVVPDADICSFNDPLALMALIEKEGGSSADIAFLDIEMGPVSGITIAKKLQSRNPKINIVFVTGYNEYATDAFELRASGYVAKPATEQKIRAEMENLRFPMPKPERREKKLSVRCFGYFDVTANGEPLKFKREKSKELLAFLVDRRGAVCTPREICACLWETDKFDYLRQLTKDLRETLKEAGAEDVFVAQFKEYHIVPSLIECDYYDYLADEPYAVKAYQGEYMLQYSWADKALV
ncbi:MAG: response regulator [Clostridia bacterium]|nr:response regulator [Clostridia bacterium]